jgi:hypothetical protein
MALPAPLSYTVMPSPNPKPQTEIMQMTKRLLLIVALLLVSSDAYAQKVVEQFSGSGIKNTRPFTVSDPWEVSWDANGSVFQIYLYDAGGSMEGVLANQQGPGEGSSYQPTPGRYYLKVNAVGNWSVEITEEPEQTSPPANQQDQNDGTIASFSGSGAKNTKPITIDSGWELRWNADGQIFQVYLYSESGSMEGVLANQSGSGRGSSYHPQGGSYYFQVNAIGDWSMEVVRAE